jgi:hypothetical protein
MHPRKRSTRTIWADTTAKKELRHWKAGPRRMRRSGNGVHRVSGLDIDEDFEFQKASWRVQRAGEVLIILFVLAGLAGLFGGGAFAKKTERFGNAEVEYSRFIRANAPVDIKITLAPSAGGTEPVSVTFDAAFFEGFKVEDISPKPRVESLGKGVVIYEFARTEHEHVPIIVRVKATKMGSASATITVGTDPPVTIKAFVFP